MQEVEQDNTVDKNGDEPSAFSEPSLVDLIKQDVKEISEAAEVYIPIPGFEKSGLAVKYRMPESGKELDDIATRVNRQFKGRFERNLNTAVDSMILLCDGLYVRPHGEEGEWYELDPEMIGEPVRFDARLAHNLGWGDEVQSAREIVRRLFNRNDVALMEHAAKLARWMGNTRTDVTREIWQDMGE